MDLFSFRKRHNVFNYNLPSVTKLAFDKVCAIMRLKVEEMLYFSDLLLFLKEKRNECV